VAQAANGRGRQLVGSWSPPPQESFITLRCAQERFACFRRTIDASVTTLVKLDLPATPSLECAILCALLMIKCTLMYAREVRRRRGQS